MLRLLVLGRLLAWASELWRCTTELAKMRHPAEFYIRAIIIRDPSTTDAQLLREIEQRGFLEPQQNYLGFLRAEIAAAPQPNPFQPFNKLHRPSMQYLRDQQVYEMFFPTGGVEEAMSYLTDPAKRMQVEQIIMSRLDIRSVASKVNRKNNWFLTEDGISAYRHFFWNLKLLTFDQWGRYLYERSSLYDRYMTLLQADTKLALFHLRLDQTIESKRMIQRAQEIAYFALEEVNQLPGVRADKVKAIGILGKTITDCHNALSTSDMALSGVLKEFERFRMENPLSSPPPIHQLAPGGNFSGSGIEAPEKEKDGVH